MEDLITVVSVPVIAAIVYWVINLIKYTTNNNEKILRFVPLMSAALGVICGVVAFYAVPDIVPASNVITAIIIGGASGLTATGTNQIFKQLGKNGSDATKNDAAPKDNDIN